MHAMNFFPFSRRIRHPFFPEWAAHLAADARGRSTALAGTFGELARAAARGVQARRAIYVLTDEGEVLNEGQRDELWRLFEVPVYELLRRDGRVEAWECEAHSGLHAADGGKEIACACGRRGAKIATASLA